LSSIKWLIRKKKEEAQRLLKLCIASFLEAGLSKDQIAQKLAISIDRIEELIN
jgi:transposase